MRSSRNALARAVGCLALALGVAGVLGASRSLLIWSVVLGAAAIGYLLGGPSKRRRPSETAPETEPPSRHETAAGPAPVPAVDESETTVTMETHPSPAGPEVRTPIDVECPSVLRALHAAAEEHAAVVAAHLWLEDPASATMRLVHAVGAMTPDPTPLPLEGNLLADAVRAGTAQLEVVARVTDGLGEIPLWRFVVPLDIGGASGAAALDVRAEESPDAEALTRIVAHLRGQLAGCLALHVARAESDTARLLLDLARDLSRTLDRDEVVALALSRAMSLSGAVTGSVMLVDPATGRLRIAEAVGLPADVVSSTEIAPGEGIAGWVLSTGRPLLIEDLPKTEPALHRHGVRSAVSVPIGDEDGILGVLNVGSREYPARFTNSHLQAVEVIGKQAAVALRNATAMESVRGAYFDTLRALVLALETKDPYATGGTARVVDYVMAVGEHLALEESELQALEVAALLHDIGMSTAADAIGALSRPLSTIERGLLKMHPVVAAEIIKQAPALQAVVPIVYHHHEWYDGHGYVGGLAGESIPLGSRILAVADAYVAMTSDRPYRKAMSEREALQELRNQAGTQFDPMVVETFELLFGEPQRSRDEA